MYGPSTSRSSAPTTGMLTAFVTSPPSRAATTCSATIRPARSCASSVEAARCGVVTTFSSPSSSPSYGSAEKTSSAAPATLPERIASASAGSSTSSPRAALTIRTPSRIRRDHVRADEPTRVVGERQVQRQEVGRVEDLLDGLGVIGAELAEPLRRDERVVADDPHAEPERPPGDLAADPAEAEHPERLVGELDATPARALPAALLQRRVRLRDVAGERDQQPDRVLGRRDDGRVGRVGDDDSAPRGRVQVDVVDPDPGPADHLQRARPARSPPRSASSRSG